MIAISQSADTFYYLNWIPSESGLVVTDYGDIKSKGFDLLEAEHAFNEVLGQLINIINVSCLFLIPNPATIGRFVADLIKLIDFLKYSTFAEF